MRNMLTVKTLAPQPADIMTVVPLGVPHSNRNIMH